MKYWINIKKRVPAAGERVKVCHLQLGVGGGGLKYQSTGYISPSGKWTVSHPDCSPPMGRSQLFDYPITHWQPIEKQ